MRVGRLCLLWLWTHDLRIIMFALDQNQHTLLIYIADLYSWLIAGAGGIIN
jgi:hypothetical protein